MGDFRTSDVAAMPFGCIRFIFVETWWLSESSVSEAAAASDELAYALVVFVGDVCRIFFVVGLNFWRIFFSFPLTLEGDDFLLVKYLLSLALFLILSLLFIVKLALVELFLIIFGFRGFAPPLMVLFRFWCAMKSPSLMMLFELKVPFWLLLLLTAFGVAVPSSPEEAVDVPMTVGDNKPLLLQLSQ